MKKYPLLKKAPQADTKEFLTFLRKNNKVVWDNPQWIVIENCKYHTKKKPWYTAFHKESEEREWYLDMDVLWLNPKFGRKYSYMIKSYREQTIKKRFHIHLFKK